MDAKFSGFLANEKRFDSIPIYGQYGAKLGDVNTKHGNASWSFQEVVPSRVHTAPNQLTALNRDPKKHLQVSKKKEQQETSYNWQEVLKIKGL